MDPIPLNEKRAFLYVLFGLGVFFVFLLRPLAIPILLAAILVILLYPTYRQVLRLSHNRPYLASFVATFLVFIILVLPFGLIVALLADQTIDFFSHLNVQENFSLLAAHDFYQSTLMPVISRLENELHVHLDLPSLISKGGSELAKYLYNFSPQVLTNTASFIFSFFVMHLSIYFLFIEGPTVARILLDLSPLNVHYETHLVIEIKNMLYATVYGYLVTALVQAALAGIGFNIAGVKAPLVFATLTFFMSLVPIVGATSVWLPISVFYFIQGNWGWGLFLFLYGAFVISGIDNVIKPMIMRGKAKIHILLIFFALFGGIQLFGPIGILFGPVIMALFVACLRLYRQDFVKKEKHA